MQQLAGERTSPADATAAREELERVDREQQPEIAAVPLDERVDLLVGGASLDPEGWAELVQIGGA